MSYIIKRDIDWVPKDIFSKNINEIFDDRQILKVKIDKLFEKDIYPDEIEHQNFKNDYENKKKLLIYVILRNIYKPELNDELFQTN